MRAFLTVRRRRRNRRRQRARHRRSSGGPAGMCRRRDPSIAHADPDGYVPFGKLVITRPGTATASPAGRCERHGHHGDGEGRSDHALHLPESRDIDTVARAVQAGEAPSRAGLYLDSACLRAIGVPRFWRRKRSSLSLRAMACDASVSPAAAAADLQGASERWAGQVVSGPGRRGETKQRLASGAPAMISMKKMIKKDLLFRK